MKTYSLIMVIVCGLFFGMASLGTLGDVAAVLGGPAIALEGSDARRYSDFDYFRAHLIESAGRADRMIMGVDGELRAQWQSYREGVESRHGETAARDLLTSLVMFTVFGGLFFAHWFAFRTYSGMGGKASSSRRPARPAARVRKLRPKTAAARKRPAASRRKAA